MSTTATPGSVLIIGAGQAGGRAAEALRNAAYAGQITLVGEEPEPPYERPALSKGVLLGTEKPESTYIHPAPWWREKQIDLVCGVRAESIAVGSRSVRFSDGRRVAYDQLILATGSRVRPLVGVNDRLQGVHYLRTIADSVRLVGELQPGRRMVVVGGGFIGLEAASSAVKRGLKVTVVERQAALLERTLPTDIAAAIERMHRAQGVDIRLGASIAGLKGDVRVSDVMLSDGSELAADVVVVGIGIIPNTELAKAAGVELTDGVVTDEFGRTNVPGIWAAGDVTRHYNPILGLSIRLESWQNAQNQAIAVAKNLCGDLVPYAEVPWFWSDQYGINIQMAGLSVAGTQTVWRGNPATGPAVAFSMAGDRLVFATAFNAPGDLRFARKLIESGVIVDARALADTGTKVKDLAARR